VTRRGPIRVLIADDHAEVRDVLAASIERREDLELVAVAADASEAVEFAARKHPDVALLDMRMPAGGGVAAARGIRTLSPDTRILALSATGVVPAGLESSIVGCIVKSSSIDEIVDSVRRASVRQGA
jgi:DNA-binding NarL/FixJ family response regulator